MLLVLIYLHPLFASTGNGTVTLSRAEADRHQTPIFDLKPNSENAIKAIATVVWIPALIFIILFLILRPLLRRVYSHRAFAGETVIASGTWLRNVFIVSPETAFSSGYSMDGCTHILAWNLALQIFGWLLLISPLPLLMNYYGAGFQCPSNMDSDIVSVYTINDGGNTTEVFCGPGRNYNGSLLTTFESLTMAGFQKGSSLVWGHVVTLWIIAFVVMFHLKQANHVFTTLRSKWLLRRPRAVACSLMAVNVTSRSDKEFRYVFEHMFPGKVVDARLVKFCEPLAKTCAKLDDVERQIEDIAQIAAEKTPVDSAQQEEDTKMMAILKKVSGPGVYKQRANLRADKTKQQAEVLELCRVETERLETPEHVAQPRSALKSFKEKAIDGLVFSEVGFVTFTDVRTFTLAAQECYSSDPRYWKMSTAPEPRDVLWTDMASKQNSTNQEQRYVIVVAAVLLFLLSFPVMSIVQGFIDQGTTAIVKEFPKLADNFLYSMVDPLVKTVAFLIFFLCLPHIFRFFIIRSGRLLDTTVRVETQFYLILFKVIFIIYASSLGSFASYAGRLILSYINVIDTPKEVQLDLTHTFGTAVSSEFPTHYAFAAGSFFVLGSVLFQMQAFIGYALQRLLFKPHELAMRAACKRSCPPEMHVERFVVLAVIFAIGLMIYQVFPLNSILFLLLCFLGSACFRYRVLYVDSDDVIDSGGLYWAQFEIFAVAVLILTQISVCIALSSIYGSVWILVSTVPLPIVCGIFLHRIRDTRWRFVPMQETEDVEDVGDCEFLYVQPQLQEAGPTRSARGTIWSTPEIPDEPTA